MMRTPAVEHTLIAALLALTATACTPDRHPAPPIPVAIATPSQYSCGTAPGFCPNPPTPIEAATCHIVDGKADRRCTPGALNPDVTQANIGTTICVKGWPASVRPPTAFTNRIKRQAMSNYGVTGSPSTVELDHLVPIEDGGFPGDAANSSDPRNLAQLWPEPWTGTPNAYTKDSQENAVHAAICAGRITLKQGQDQLLAKWSR